MNVQAAGGQGDNEVYLIAVNPGARRAYRTVRL